MRSWELRSGQLGTFLPGLEGAMGAVARSTPAAVAGDPAALHEAPRPGTALKLSSNCLSGGFWAFSACLNVHVH